MQDIYLNIDQLSFGYSLTIFVTFQFLDELTTFTQFGHIAVTSLLVLLVHGELPHNSSKYMFARTEYVKYALLNITLYGVPQ